MTTRDAELSELCRACGACCRGVMFGVVELADKEQLSGPVRHRLRVVNGTFPQPCSAHNGSTCTLYEDRPASCRNYTCGLYRAHAAGDGAPLSEKLALVTRIRELADTIREDAPDHVGSIRGVVAALLVDRSRWREHPSKLLDIAELAMRLQRDLAWKPD